MKRYFSFALAFVLCLTAPATSAWAQANAAQLRLVIVDETGAGVPAASVTVTPAEGGTPVTGISDDKGVAVLPEAPAGNVQIHVEFPGFLPTDQPLTLRRGANNQTVTLKIEGFQEEVVVTDTTATDDRRGNAMSTTLEESDVEALPDDPDALVEMLTQMAGPAGAVFQVNGFRGGRLPSRDEIRQIRFRTNSFSADNHDAGRTQVEIITRPNVRQWSGNANMNYRSDAMNARNAFSREKTPELNRQFNFGARGPIIPNRTSIRLNVDGRRDNQADTIFAQTPTQTFSEFVRRPSNSTNVTVGVEHAVNNNQTLRLEFRGGVTSSENNGVGGFNLRERATNREGDNQQLRAQLQGIVGTNGLNEIRLQYNQQSSQTTSVSDAVAIIVQDQFTSGGAGANNRNSSKQFELADNLDFNVGRRQQMRVGFLLEGGGFQYFDQSNANGSFTFSSLDDYIAGHPQFYRVREGSVQTDFNVTQLGLYWQDDIRLSNKLSVSVGVRNEMQSLISDKTNFMPRLGFTWNPIGPRTSIRGGYGMFYDWYESNLYDQTLRVNGIAQRDILILEPGFPNPYGGQQADVQPGGRIQAAADLKMPFFHQSSIGVEHQITQNLSGQVSYQMLRGRNQMRAINQNQPVPTVIGFDANGAEVIDYIRPDLTVGNITQFESTGRSTTDRLTFNMNYRVPNRQMFMGGNYTLGQVKNHTDSPTSLPMDSLRPELEWGSSRQDIRHRLQAFVNLPLPWSIRSTFNVNGQSAAPYTITTGTDTNEDGVLAERPDGIGRNTARGKAIWNVNLRISKQFAIGGPRGDGGPGGFPGGPGAPRPVSEQRGQGGGGNRGGGGNNPLGARYTMELFVSGDNVLNNVNYTNFSGNLQSRLYGQPTSAQAPRRMQVGMSFRF